MDNVEGPLDPLVWSIGPLLLPTQHTCIFCIEQTVSILTGVTTLGALDGCPILNCPYDKSNITNFIICITHWFHIHLDLKISLYKLRFQKIPSARSFTIVSTYVNKRVIAENFISRVPTETGK